jgi:cell division protein FtsI/penicillin-binding protein 2
MSNALEPVTAGATTSIEIADHIEQILGDGQITEFDVARTGEANKTEGAAAVPYEISYTSEASDQPVTLTGELELLEDEEAGTWGVVWDDALFFPGLPRAVTFKITSKNLRRGAIVDRRGRPLATGSDNNRNYPWGSSAGSVIGHLEPATRQDLRDLGPGYQKGDLIGASGLERAYQAELAGSPATTLAIVDAKGRVQERIGNRAGTPGARLRTTLDIRVQRAAEAAYGGTTGGAVVMNPRTGDLLAIVSSAPFNPNNYVGVAGIEPFNRALSGTYPPGSSMKVVTAAAALDTKVVKPSTMLNGPANYFGVRNFEGGDFGRIDFATAVQKSVNTAFAQVALDLGAERMTEYAERFGFNADPQMPLPAATSSFPLPEDDSDLMWGSIGQAQVLATPMQMASVAATIANRGKRMEPRISYLEEPTGARAVSRSSALKLTDMMRSVVTGGTGTAANIAGADVAGKTGTAEVTVDGEIMNHGWFICFAPAANPRVAVAVVSELGGVGGQVAAPLARGILLGVLPLVR